jgi:hypothetical protein
MNNNKILEVIAEYVSDFSHQESADFIWDVICQTNLIDATMDRIDEGYEIVLQMSLPNEE